MEMTKLLCPHHEGAGYMLRRSQAKVQDIEVTDATRALTCTQFIAIKAGFLRRGVCGAEVMF